MMTVGEREMDMAKNNAAVKRMNQETYIEDHLSELEACHVEIVWDLVKKMVGVDE